MSMNQVHNAPIDPIGNGLLYTDLSTAVILTPPPGSDVVYLQAFDQDVRFTLDGTTATTTNLFAIIAGYPPIAFSFTPGVTFSVIEEVAGATLAVHWGRL